MYAREEDVLSVIYRQLKDYVNEHYITNSAYKQQIQEYTDKFLIFRIVRRRLDQRNGAL